MTRYDRILGSLCLAGMGDALGAPTEQWSIDEILAAHGGLVKKFTTPPADTFAGVHSGKSAEVTDDASQMYYLVKALCKTKGALTYDDWLACLLDWADTSPKAGFMGPSTAGVINAIRSGQSLDQVGVIGTTKRKVTTIGNTNGAAMRVGPCGLVHPGDVRAACDLALVTCLPTHDTDIAVASACAIAAGVAEAMNSVDFESVVMACIEGAGIGERVSNPHVRKVAGAKVSSRIELALRIAGEADEDVAFLRSLEAYVGNSVLAAESVPAAIGIFAYAKGDPMRVIQLASTAGNDTDSIATMAGAMAGALHGASALPVEMMEEFKRVNSTDFDLEAMARELSSIIG